MMMKMTPVKEWRVFDSSAREEIPSAQGPAKAHDVVANVVRRLQMFPTRLSHGIR